MTPQPKSGNAGIREIANALGISIGTVDRAIHGRSGVSKITRERVLSMAKQLDYTPNLAARHLRLSHRLCVGVFLPREIASFYNMVRSGILAAAKAAGSAVEVQLHEFPHIGDGDWETLKQARWEDYDGIIFAPGNAPALAEFWDAAATLRRPVVLVTTDAPHSQRLASVAVDGEISGSIAAELLGRGIREHGTVAIFTGDVQVQDHSDKVRGFAGTLALLAPHLTLLPPVENHDRPDLAYAAAKKVLQSQPELKGIYCGTANSLPLLRAAREAGLLGSLQIVTTDLFPELVSYLDQGAVLATLEQRPFTQGRRAFEVLCSFLAKGEQQQVRTRLAPHIVLRSNLPLFLQRLNQP